MITVKSRTYKTPSWVYIQFKGVWEKVPANRIARRIFEREQRLNKNK